jgi:hypothetical protein
MKCPPIFSEPLSKNLYLLKDISMFGKWRGAVRVACIGQIKTTYILGMNARKDGLLDLNIDLTDQS